MLLAQDNSPRWRSLLVCISLSALLLACNGGGGESGDGDTNPPSNSNGGGSNNSGTGNTAGGGAAGSNSGSGNTVAGTDGSGGDTTGGSGLPPSGGPGAPGATTLSVAASLKQMHFSWPAVSTATYYQLYRNADGVSGFTQVGGDFTGTSYDQEVAAHRFNWGAARYILDACNAAGCTASNSLSVGDAAAGAIGYFKASDTQANDIFARALGLSSDGNTLAVGATGKGGSAGAVYIFTRQGSSWSQTGYVKAADAASGDSFGEALALSGDGNTLAVGAYLEDSISTGINGSTGGIAENNSNRGAVYVFTRGGGGWTQQAYVKASSSHDNAYFGGAVSLNNDGNTLAVGATGERTGGMDAGAVYVFMRVAGVWSQQGFVKSSAPMPGAHFGAAVTLSGDGSTLAAGAPDEYNGSDSGGSVYVFALTAGAWSQQSAVKASNTSAFDAFGSALSLSADGASLAVGAQNEKSAATGIDGNQADRTAGGAGAAYVFTRSAGAWSQQAYIKASNTAQNAAFGSSLAFSGDASTLAVGASGEASAATGVGGNQNDSTRGNAGAVYVYTRAGAWSQQNYVKAPNTGANDFFGYKVALNGDGNTLAVGAFGEASAATGIGGNQADNAAANAGAAYLY